MKKKTRSGNFIIKIENKIVFIETLYIESLNLEEAKESIELVYELNNYQPALLFCDYSKIKSQTKECREYYASAEVANKLIKRAIFSNNPNGQLLANFYIGINKPITSTKFFTNKDEGINWLKKPE